MQNVVVFDFDGTITRKDTLEKVTHLSSLDHTKLVSILRIHTILTDTYR